MTSPARRPKAVIAHLAGITFFSDADLAELARVVDIADPAPIGSWDDPRAATLLADAEVIIGHWGCPPVGEQVLAMAPNLALFAYAAGTVKGTVEQATFEAGVRVTSGAKANAEPVAEFTLAAVLFALKDVFFQREVLRDPALFASQPEPAVPSGNWGKTVGLVGASLIGRRVIELLAPFDHLQVALYDPYVDSAEADSLGVVLLGLDELCAASDVLSIHAPDLPETHHMVGAAQLAALRTGSTLINTARGRLVDHDALIAELEAGRLKAVLDVTDPEPLPDDSPLRTLPNVFLTPHVAGSQGTELARMAAHVAEEVERWQAGRPGLNAVRWEQLPRLA